jgi:Zn-dependent peptidase ImmA (M78 family)
MDPIELGRQHARRLHDEAVQRGRDPWSPYEFAVGIAKDLGIRVETCAPGGALLDGGRASFFPDVPLIVHETKGSLFDQAFLVAHEIGHAELGDGEEEPEPAVNVDPARTSEAAPVGMDRVVDYSRRQRREVQMDLFARELLLPMHVVVDLHVVQGQTCSTIATRLGAPFEVVAQQMLDALLLPAFPVVAATDPVEIPLNKKQETAAATAAPRSCSRPGLARGRRVRSWPVSKACSMMALTPGASSS